MIDVDVSGGSIRGLTRAAITLFVNDSIQALRRGRAAKRDVSEVSVRFVDDAEMTRLNATYRRRKKTTDVLTFAADEFDGDGSQPLGDIVISLPQAQRQAAAEGHSLATEVRYLLLHGIIHAFGYDHENDSGEMDALERRIRAKVGLD